MFEITISGANEITFPNISAWGWEIALYLFLGGLVAGLMILGGAFRLFGSRRFERASALGDLVALPLLGLGMLLLFIDLSSKVNVWRLYTTFQISSPMSWGSWILLLAMILLALRFIARLPSPRPVVLFGVRLFQPAPPSPVAGGEGQDAHDDRTATATCAYPVDETREALHTPAAVERGWWLLNSVALLAKRWERPQAALGILLGIGVGFYTGVLLSAMEARPLWNSAALAPLFLASGLASGIAFLCLFTDEDEHIRLVPFSMAICGIELLLIAAYALTIALGSESARSAGAILFGGAFGVMFWGIVVFIGLLVPATVEALGALRHSILLPARVPPVMKLAGGVTLRFVIVYAGLRCFM